MLNSIALMFLLISIELIATSCSAFQRPADDMCKSIARFATSIDDDAVHQVVLFTSWGGPLAVADNSIALEACQHRVLAPEKEFCSYLMENTSTEFPGGNVRRALACLNTSKSAPYMGRRSEYTMLKVYSRTAKYVGGRAVVGVEFYGSEEKMVISVQRTHRGQ